MIKDLEDKHSNLTFNLKTIKRNKGLRGVIFKETRDLFPKVDRSSKIPQWQQLVNLITDEILEIEVELEQLKTKEYGTV